MKKIIVGATFMLLAQVATAMASEVKSTNEMIKDCLVAYQYDYNAPVEERINKFDWQSASNCVSGFVIEKHNQHLAKQKSFLDEKPWFRGSNWKWQERAEYNCNKVYSDVGPITVCSRTYYVN